MSKKKSYMIINGFSLHGKRGEARLQYGPGEPVPKEILDDPALLRKHINAGNIAELGPEGIIEKRKVIELSEDEINNIVEQKSLAAVQRVCRARNVSRNSLSVLFSRLEEAKATPDVLKHVEEALDR